MILVRFAISILALTLLVLAMSLNSAQSQQDDRPAEAAMLLIVG
jgi:hypothetical protein